ncbi:hypothetical protein ACIBEA_39685 [Streptomyces sp. NPDC051555]|uniref:hypothetical protein n=1 Tax=Streptomyces sp. NPDC051555 TaxID=3365657 RepID=UPI00378FC3ED
MLTDRPAAHSQTTAPYRVEQARPRHTSGLQDLIAAHYRVCPAGEWCRQAEALESAAALDPGGDGVWVMTDAASGRATAAAVLEAGLLGSGVGVLHVRHLIADPDQASDRPVELLSAWCTRRAAQRPASIREVHFHSQCPLALRTRPSRAVLTSEHVVIDGYDRRIDVRPPALLPSLPELVASRPDTDTADPYEVSALHRTDHAALVHCLEEAGTGGRAQDYPLNGGRRPVKGRKIMGYGALVAVFALSSTPPTLGSTRARPAGLPPVLSLERLLLLDAGLHLDFTVWLTGWITREARRSGLSLGCVTTTDGHLARQLTLLDWHVVRIRCEAGGLTRQLELRVSPPDRHQALSEELR